MREFLEKETKLDLIGAVIYVILGVVIACMPTETLNLMTYLIESFFIIIGIITIINFIKVSSKNDIFSMGFIHAVACILIAVFLILNPTLLVSILPVCIGIWMLIGSLKKLQLIMRLGSIGVKVNFLYIIFAILMLTISVVAILNPFETAALIVRMLGIGIVVYSIFDLFENVSILKYIKKLQ